VQTSTPPDFPQPDDVLIGILTLLGAPVVVVILVGIFLSVISWGQAGLGVYRTGAAATRTVRAWVLDRTTQASRARLGFYFVAPLFIASFVTAARFTPAYFGPSALWVDWSWTWYLFSFDNAALWYFIGTAASVALWALGELARSKLLKIAVAVVWTPLLAATFLAGLFWAIGGVGCLLGWLLNFGGEGQTTYTWAATTNFIVLALPALGSAPLAGLVLDACGRGFGDGRDTIF